MKLKLNQLAVSVAAMTIAGFSFAATDTANLAVSASVLNVCSIGTGTLAFGPLALGVTAGAGTLAETINKDVNTTVPVVCTNGASATVTGGLGLNAAGSVRKMKISGVSDVLPYELYTTDARTTVLSTSAGITYAGNGSAETVIIYGRVASAAIVAATPGAYTDTVALTITYTP